MSLVVCYTQILQINWNTLPISRLTMPMEQRKRKLRKVPEVFMAKAKKTKQTWRLCGLSKCASQDLLVLTKLLSPPKQLFSIYLFRKETGLHTCPLSTVNTRTKEHSIKINTHHHHHHQFADWQAFTDKSMLCLTEPMIKVFSNLEMPKVNYGMATISEAA